MTQENPFDANLARLRAIEEDIGAGKLHEAAAALNALVAATPSDVRIYLSGAMLARAAGNPAQEIMALQRAVALAPHWPPAQIELAKTLSREGRHAEAVAAANRAVELAPQNLMALEVTVAVANAAGDAATALRHLRTAHALKPADTTIGRALGICLAKQGDYREAEAHWHAVLAQNPDDAPALGWLGTCLIGLDRKDEACAVLQRAVTLSPDNPSLEFHLAIARGETPRTQPAGMIQQLFDSYASRFDRHLVGQLKYRVPKRVAEIISQRHSDRDVSVLDLGCGTGLLGVCLGRIAGAFVGVDVSPKMIEQATRHGIYTELRQSDLLDELQRVPPASFDYVVANDVFIYVGELSGVIPAAFKVLRSNGAMIFSCETAGESEGDLALRASKRYAHSPSSIETLCHGAGFSHCEIEPIELRFDVGNVPIAGFIAVALKR